MKYITSKILASPLLLFPSLSLIDKISPGSYFFFSNDCYHQGPYESSFFFLPVIIYIYIFESIYYSLKCLKVHVCNYCSYLEVRVQSMQVHGVRALNDNVHVALEKGSYKLDSTGSRIFYSCSFLF